EPARRLGAIVDPARLRADLMLATERHTRECVGGWLRRAKFELIYDAVSLEYGELRREFYELKLRRVADGGPALAAIAAATENEGAVRPTNDGKIDHPPRVQETIGRES